MTSYRPTDRQLLWAGRLLTAAAVVLLLLVTDLGFLAGYYVGRHYDLALPW